MIEIDTLSRNKTIFNPNRGLMEQGIGIWDLTKSSVSFSLINLKIQSFINLTEDAQMRPDLVALQSYGDLKYTGSLMKINSISNPFAIQTGTVFAIPGSLNRPFSKGCNLLIRNNKATIYTSWDDFMQELNWEQAKDRLALHPELIKKLFTLNESNIISLLHREGQLSSNELLQRSEILQDELALILLNLELNGMIQSTDGDGFMLS